MSLKDPDATAAEPFRRLSRNDIYQTTDQWKERTLQKLGETSGLWATWAKQGESPKLPEEASDPPVKPSSEATMRALRTRMRARSYSRAVAADPKVAEEKKEEDFPLSDEYEAWQEYKERNSGTSA